MDIINATIISPNVTTKPIEIYKASPTVEHCMGSILVRDGVLSGDRVDMVSSSGDNVDPVRVLSRKFILGVKSGM